MADLSWPDGVAVSRREFKKAVKLLAFDRSGGQCQHCTAHLYSGKIHYDHIIPDALGGEPTLSNCQVLCSTCHALKTAQADQPAIAQAIRRQAAHISARNQGPGRLKSRRSPRYPKPLWRCSDELARMIDTNAAWHDPTSPDDRHGTPEVTASTRSPDLKT